MMKLLLMVSAAVAVSSWIGGGEVLVEAQSGRLVFSDELELITKTPPSCLASNNIGGELCEDDPEYNDLIKNRITRLMERNRGVNTLLNDPSLRDILNDVEPSIHPPPPLRADVRFGGDTETPVCSAQETLVYPKRAKTPNDEWVFVLNQEGVQQALRVEKCTSEGSQCLGMVLPNGGTATCRQKYIYRRMLVLGTNNIEPEEVLMPSCCVCYTTYQGLVTRSGNSTGSRKPTPPRNVPGNQPMTPALSGPAPPPVAGHTHPHPMPLGFGRSGRRFRRISYPPFVNH